MCAIAVSFRCVCVTTGDLRAIYIPKSNISSMLMGGDQRPQHKKNERSHKNIHTRTRGVRVYYVFYKICISLFGVPILPDAAPRFANVCAFRMFFRVCVCLSVRADTLLRPALHKHTHNTREHTRIPRECAFRLCALCVRTRAF